MNKRHKHKKTRLSIRNLVFLPLGAAILIFILFFTYIFFFDMIRMLSDSEHAYNRQLNEAVSSNMIAFMTNSKAVARDWSSRDEAYAFVKNENPNYIKDIWEAKIPLLQHQFNFIVIKDLDGKNKYVHFYDYINEKTIPVPDGFTDFIAPLANEMLVDYSNHSDESSKFKSQIGMDGFTYYDGVAYYICSLPILPEAENGEPMGTFTIGRIINGFEMQFIANNSDLEYSLISVADFGGWDVNHDSYEDDEAIYKYMPGFAGHEGVILKTNKSHSLYQNGLKVINRTYLILGFVILIFAIILFALVDRYLLNPIKRLCKDVCSVADAGATIETRHFDGSHEFYTLGTSINDMLNRLSQSTASLNVLESILNGIDTYLYVSDPHTDEILFVNDKMLEEFHLSDDVVGKTCWEVLRKDSQKRCDFCPNNKLEKNPDVPIVWEEEDVDTGKYYKKVDCIIDWVGGTKVHLQHRTDITDIKQAQAAVNKRLEQEKLLSAISKNFITEDDPTAFIQDTLQMTGKFMNVNQVFLSRFSEEQGLLQCLYEWHDEHARSFKGDDGKWPISPDMQIYKELTSIGYHLVNDFDFKTHPHFEKTKDYGMKAFLNISIEISGKLWGILGFVLYENPYEWTNSDIFLGRHLSSILTEVMNRQGMKERLLRMSSIVDSSQHYITYINKEGEYGFVNPAVTKITGYSHDELYMNGQRILFDKKTNQYIYDELIPQVLKDGEKEVELPFIRKDGENRIFLFSAFVIESDQHGIGCIATDITEEKHLEEQLLLMSSIVNSSPQYICCINEDGKYEFINSATPNITGYTYDELMENDIYMMHDEETQEYIRDEIFPNVLKHGKQSFELPIIRKNGEERIMSFSAFTMDSDRTRIAVISDDVTLRKKLERELTRAKEAAEDASQAKGEFLSRMSHEMRTPMNAIIGMTNIARNTSDTEKKEYCLDRIDTASKHLLGVINDVLDMSKIEANKFELSYNEFDFENMLMNVFGVVNFRAEEKKQNIIVHLNKNVPQFIIGDEQRLNQVLTNLLTNAIKFTPEGGRIVLNAYRIAEVDGTYTLQLEVTDNGIGISKDQQSRLFQSFEQADGGIARKYGGTGLGLAISKRIVDLMDGNIWVVSEPGKGSTFAFTIKVKKGKNQPMAKLSSQIKREDIHILTVDDSSEVREYFLHVMKSFDLPCDVAANGMEALEMIQNCKDKPYNIFFIDWKMPNINGIELTKKIKEITDHNAVVIMISVVEWSDIEKEAIEAGVNRFIPKPLFRSSIINTINECLGVLPDKKSVPEKTESITPDFSGHTLLLAEDVDVNREIIDALLSDTHVSIEYAENGLQAIQMFEANPNKYSLILMDIHMPEMDGYEATRHIRSLSFEHAKNIPIVAMTANVFREDIEMCLKAGMNNHVGKPVDEKELVQKLSTYLKPKVDTNEDNVDLTAMESEDIKEIDYNGYLPYIDLAEALSRLKENKKLYFTLLSKFAGKQMSEELITYMKEKDFKKIADTAHALKGSSANLGLNELKDLVTQIEGRAKMEMECEEMIEPLKESVDNTLHTIRTLLEKAIY